MKKNAVLLYRSGSLGDGIVTIPALDLYYSSRSPKHLGLVKILLYATDSEISGNFDLFDVLKCFNLVDLGYRYRGYNDLFKAVNILRREYIIHDLIYLPPKRTLYQLIRDWLFFKFTLMPRHAIGFSSLVFRKSIGSEAQRLCDVLQLGTIIGANFFEECSRVRERIGYRPVRHSGTRHVGVFVSAKSKPSKLPSEYWVGIIRTILKNNKTVVLFGDPDECFRISKNLSSTNVTIAPRVDDLATFFSNILWFDEVLTLDSGGAHMAALTGTKTHVIAGSREPAALWRPIGRDVRVFRSEVPCAECFLSACPNDNACVKAAATSYSDFLQYRAPD